MTCNLCGYENIDVHKNHDTLITYCQQCGNDTKEKIESRPDRWSEDQHQLRIIQGGNEKTSHISHTSPLPKKKKKKRKA